MNSGNFIRKGFMFNDSDYVTPAKETFEPVVYGEDEAGFNAKNDMFVKNMQINSQTADKKSVTYTNQQMQKNNVSFDKMF